MPKAPTVAGAIDPLAHIPEPGSVFREFTFRPAGKHFAECDPASKQEFCLKRQQIVPRELDLDLGHAVRAEMPVEYWGGHIGTADQKFRANGNAWIQIPQPAGTPTGPQRYYRNVMGTLPGARWSGTRFSTVNRQSPDAAPELTS